VRQNYGFELAAVAPPPKLVPELCQYVCPHRESLQGVSMEERRSRPRLSVSLEAVWDSETDNHPALITDLSLGGCYINTVGEARVGESVGFRVLLPDGDWLYIEGEVRHHRGRGFGVMFIDLEPEQQQKIEWLLQLAREAGTESETIAANLVAD